MKNNTKRKVLSFVGAFTILLGAFSGPVIHADSKSELNTGLKSYSEDAENAMDIFNQFTSEDMEEAKKDRDSFKGVLYRLFSPLYIDDVSNGVLANELQDPRIDGSVCKGNDPQNLLNHNCDVPNFAAELLQNLSRTMGENGVTSAVKTSSRPAFNLGVPVGIPGGHVPVNDSDKSHKYTALELYGYNLPFTTYTGEWDDISVSTESRMLSNFGLMDKLTLTGTSIWNGMSSGLGALIEGFSFNPMKWAGNVFGGVAGSTFSSILDTTELNTIASYGWTRVSFGDTLYNVYTLSDKEVIIESGVRYMKHFTDKLSELANESPELQEVMALQAVPAFEYDPMKETQASKDAREAVIKHNEKVDEDGKGKHKELPEPIYMTEAEQLNDWRTDNANLLSRAKKQGLIDDKSDKYEDIVKVWNEKWSAYSKREFAANGIVVADLQKEAEKDYFLKDPYGDPKRQISHYVCATPDGKPMRSANGQYEYLYTDENSNGKEHVNPNCGEVRPSIKGGLFNTNTDDTRRQGKTKSPIENIPVLGDISNGITRLLMKVGQSTAKFTNAILSLSFTPILEELGVTKIATSMMAAFRDTMFFPLIIMAAVIGTFITFIKFVRTSSARSLFITVIIGVGMFIVGAIIMLKPSIPLMLIEHVPNKVDNAVATFILGSDHENDMCTVTDGVTSGVRSAQCNVWKNTVLTPWVHGQFGTSYENLATDKMTNQNQALVGDAGVYMGGGHTEHNWAMYQLSVLKSGTITDKDLASKTGMTDPNIYRLVDLQAGPNNGKLSDGRYYKSWTGEGSGRFTVALMSSIQGIITLITIGSLSFMKIQYTFMFAIYMIALPIVLLKAFYNNGQFGIRKYAGSMLSFFYKRTMSVVLLSLLLRMMGAVGNTDASYMVIFIMSTALMVTFLVYKNELMKYTGLANNEMNMSEVKQSIVNSVPKDIRQKAAMSGAKLKGNISGYVGGFAAGLSDKSMVDENGNHKLEFDGDGNAIRPSLISSMRNANKHAKSRSQAGGLSLEARRERNIRRQGFGSMNIVNQVKQEVVDDGAQNIVDEALTNETYKELMSHTDRGNTKYTTKSDLTKSDAILLRDAKTQALIRKEAQRRREALVNDKAQRIDDNQANAVKELNARIKRQDLKDVFTDRDNAKKQKEIKKLKGEE